MGKLKIYGCSFSEHDPYGWTHRLAESKNMDFESYSTPGKGFTFLRENIIRTASDWRDDDIVIIQYSFHRRMWLPYFEDNYVDYDLDEYLAVKTRQPDHQELREDVKKRPEMKFSHTRAEVNWTAFMGILPLLRKIKPSNLYIWLCDGEWWDGYVCPEQKCYIKGHKGLFESNAIRNPWWDGFIEEHGDILLRFGDKKQYSCYMEWLGKENQAIKNLSIKDFDLHQSQWGYDKQAEWFEEQIWGLK